MAHISEILLKPNTRVLALVIFYDNRKQNEKKMFIVMSCVIYTILSKYVFIDYLGYEKSKLSYYALAFMGGTHILIKIMTTYWYLEFYIYY